jgi:hypothetical protein
LASIEKSSGELLRAIVEDSNVSNETIAALSGAYGVGSSSYNALLNSTGTISTYSTQYDYTAVGIVYVIFSYLWTTTFVQGILSLTISGAVAEWWVRGRVSSVHADIISACGYHQCMRIIIYCISGKSQKQ